MKTKNKKIKLLFKWILLVFIIVPILVIVFISPLTKYLVEKYDVKYIGREVKMDWAYVNPFTGYIHFENFKIYESGSDSLFLSTSGLSANFSVYKLFKKTYEITELELDHLHGSVIQNGKSLNLDDIIKKFTSTDKSEKKKDPVKFSILHIKINDGIFVYQEITTPINISIIKLDLESSGIRWNSDTIGAKFSFKSGFGTGDIGGDLTINTKNLNYRLSTAVGNFDLNFINQYLKELVNFGSFHAILDANIKATGNFQDAKNLIAKGKFQLKEFHFGKDSTNDYASFDTLLVDIIELSPKNHKYLFDSLLLKHPYFKYEQYDYLNNIETMFGKKASLANSVNKNPEKFNLVLQIGKYVKQLSENFLSSNYQINKLSVTRGDITYNDYSLNEKFSLVANPLFIEADSIDKNHKRVEITLNSAIQPYGNTSVSLSINPKDSSDFDLNYHFQKFSLAMFNPYIITYTSFPLDRGTLELNGKWKVRNGFIESTNHLIVVDPRVSKRIRKNDSKWIPLPLAMAFIRERGNVIDYEIPITGNIKNPSFSWRDIIIDLVKNIFIKPPTTPYGLEVRNVENEVEKSHSLKWSMRQFQLFPSQQKFLKKIALFLKKNPTASITINPIIYSEKEKECILFFEAKKKYFLQIHNKKVINLTKKDSIEIDRMQIKDSVFVMFLNKFCNNPMLNTIQEKCFLYVGVDLVNEKYQELEQKRERSFRSIFKENETNGQVKFKTPTSQVPYNGFSYFSIKYTDEIPESLKKAYLQMQKLNEENPRKLYFLLRKKEAKKYQSTTSTSKLNK